MRASWSQWRHGVMSPPAIGYALAAMPPRSPAPSARSADDLLAEGHAGLARRRPQEAFAAFQRALALDGSHPGAWHGLGLAYLALGQREVGLGLLRKAVDARPRHARWRRDLAQALIAGGTSAQAREQLEAAVDLEPGDAGAWRDLAALCLHLGDLDAAEARYRTAATLASERADLHEALARLAWRRGRVDEALAHAARAIALQPSLAHQLIIGHVRPATTAPMPRATPAQLRAPTGAQAAALEAAIAARDIHVLDDVLADPHGHRTWALGQWAGQAALDGRANFPGAQTPAQPCDALMQRIADALGRPLKWNSIDQGAIRLSRADDRARCDIHVDHQSAADTYAGVLYLTLPEHARGGTSFWRHRATGWERRPDAATLAAAGYPRFVDFERRWIPVDRTLAFADWQARRGADWQWLFELPMRFNRLVVYRSDFFHSISDLFGHGPDDGRLVQLLYFEAA
jgi:tetratricopeptide (TPR) repeat protein